METEMPHRLDRSRSEPAKGASLRDWGAGRAFPCASQASHHHAVQRRDAPRRRWSAFKAVQDVET